MHIKYFSFICPPSFSPFTPSPAHTLVPISQQSPFHTHVIQYCLRYRFCMWEKTSIFVFFSLALEQAFSHPLLRLWTELFLTPNLTGTNWWQLEMEKRHRIDRQTESWGQVCCLLRWRHTTLIACFLYHSLHLLCFLSLSLFFKGLLLFSSLKPCF
jgi:hypothetical protein